MTEEQSDEEFFRMYEKGLGKLTARDIELLVRDPLGETEIREALEQGKKDTDLYLKDRPTLPGFYR
jgi:hypothetical protein